MKRREFIRTAGFLTAVGVAASTFRRSAEAVEGQTVAEALPPSHAHAHGNGPAIPDPATVLDDFSYRGRRVRVLHRGGRARLFRKRAAECETVSIDGHERSPHIFTRVGEHYASHMLPYETYRNPRDLAKRLIDEDGRFFIL
jgi:hypothetical protein